MKKETIGQRIKEIREKKKITQKQLSEACGILYQTIGKYERGVLNPKLETIRKIAYGLDVPMSEIIGDILDD